MSEPPNTIDDQDVRCPDLQLSDEGVDALVKLLVDAALREIEKDTEAAA